MRRIVVILLIFVSISVDAQVDRIELGVQTTKRGVVWARSGLPTHQPAWRLSRDTNAVFWYDTITSLRYDWDYANDVWRTKGVSTSALPPLPTQTSGSATIDNRTANWRPASNILHRYDHSLAAWVPLSLVYQSAAPSEIASGGGNGAATYRKELWIDSDDDTPYYWDGAAWTAFGAGGAGTVTSVALSLPTSVFDISGSPVTTTGTLTAAFDNQSANTFFRGPNAGGAATPSFGPLVAADIPAGIASLWTDAGAFTYLTATGDRVVVGSSTEINSAYQFQSNGHIIAAGGITATAGDAYNMTVQPAATNFYGTGIHGAILQIGSIIGSLGVNKSAIGSIVPANSLLVGGVSPGSITALTDHSNQPLLIVAAESATNSVAIINGGFYGWSGGTGSLSNTSANNFTINGPRGTGTGTAGDIIFATANVGASGSTGHTLTNRVAIQGNTGFVGILNTSPSQALHVTGNARVTGGYFDSSNSDGNSGDILTSTGSATAWASPSALTGFWLDGGNTTGGTLVGGTNDNNPVSLETNNVVHWTLSSGASTGGAITHTTITANTSTIEDAVTDRVNSTGTPAAGYGFGWAINQKSSTTDNRPAVRMETPWTTATNGAETADIVFKNVVAGTMSEHLRIQGGATPALKIGGGSTSYTNTAISGSAAYTIQTTSTSSAALSLTASGNSTTNSILIGNSSFTTTSGTKYDVRFNSGYTVSSGTGGFYNILAQPIINQTTSTGATGFLHINPTLTNIAGGYKAIHLEVNNSAAWGIYQAGSSTKNNLEGATRIGSTSAPTRTLEVTGEALISDLTTTAATKIVGADNNGVLSGITVSTGLDLTAGVLTATGSGGDGIYGGDGSLPAGGTDVDLTAGTIRWNMASGASIKHAMTIYAGTSNTASRYLTFHGGADSVRFQRTGGHNYLQHLGSGNFQIQSANILEISADSIDALEGAIGTVTSMPHLLGLSDGGVIKRFEASETGMAAIWDEPNNQWEAANPMNGTYALKSSSSETLTGYNYVEEYDANAGAIAVTMGSAMYEGAIYTIRCRRNGTNQITFTAEGGYSIAWDTDSTTSGDASVAVGGVSGTGFQAPFKVYTARRSGTLIYIH
jgi:hypothetical protein